MQLLHFPRPAHVVHQEVSVAFAPNESHNAPSFSGSGTALHRTLFHCNCCVVYGGSTTWSMVRQFTFPRFVSNASLGTWNRPTPSAHIPGLILRPAHRSSDSKI